MNEPQKIFDIIPPKITEEKMVKVEPPKIQNKEEVIFYDGEAGKPEVKPKKKRSFLGKFFIFCLIILIVFILVANFVLARVEIQIWPKIEVFSLRDKITVSTSKPVVDINNKTIPGKIIQDEESASQEYAATGKVTKEEKAQGTIRIYNTYSTVAQVLISNTRFISSDGKLFRTVERVIVPGETYDNKGKLQPGSVDVKVMADKAGKEYNIEPTTFSIPGFVGTPKYMAFYGKSALVMTGGAIGEVIQVTKNDLDNAKKDLTNKLIAQGNLSIKSKIPEGYQLVDNSSSSEDEIIVYEIIQSSSSVPAGTETDRFTQTVKIDFKTLVFKQSDLIYAVKGIITPEIDKSKKIVDKSLGNIMPKIDSLNLNSGTATVNLDVSAKIYTDINQEQLKQLLSGKSFADVRTILANQPQIDRSQIKTWPFWVNRVPQKQEKIGMDLVLD